jgi:glucosamine-6-phosphate deaminase
VKIIKVNNYEAISKKAAEYIVDTIKNKPNAVIGMATGSTAEGTYEYLVRAYLNNEVRFKEASSVNLDEYVGLSPKNEQSYHAYMDHHLFDHIDMPAENNFIPNGEAIDLQGECARYEARIEELGGVDLQLLGLGHNGHIGFNEPGTSFSSKTQVVDLAESTRKANARFFDVMEEVPSKAITMGIATILKSKQILLLVSGKGKAEILNKLLESEQTESIPATALKGHHDVTIIADADALSLYEQKHNGELKSCV